MLPPLEMTGGGMVSYIMYAVFDDVSLSVCRHLERERELGETLRPRGFAVAVHPNLPSLEGRGTACGGGVPIEAPQATEGF